MIPPSWHSRGMGESYCAFFCILTTGRLPPPLEYTVSAGSADRAQKSVDQLLYKHPSYVLKFSRSLLNQVDFDPSMAGLSVMVLNQLHQEHFLSSPGSPVGIGCLWLSASALWRGTCYLAVAGTGRMIRQCSVLLVEAVSTQAP